MSLLIVVGLETKQNFTSSCSYLLEVKLEKLKKKKRSVKPITSVIGRQSFKP